jgi:hypothetical protein
MKLGITLSVTIHWAGMALESAAADRSTYEEPHRYATGISTVVVNGQIVIDGGDHTGALRVLRRGGLSAKDGGSYGHVSS